MRYVESEIDFDNWAQHQAAWYLVEYLDPMSDVRTEYAIGNPSDPRIIWPDWEECHDVADGSPIYYRRVTVGAWQPLPDGDLSELCKHLPGPLVPACGVPRRLHDDLGHPFTQEPTPMSDERRFEIEASMSAADLREYMNARERARKRNG